MKNLKLLFAASVALVTSFGAFAAPTAKAVPKSGTLTFVYDEVNYGTKGTDWFSVAEAVAQKPTVNPPWYGKSYTKVVFDDSFISYKPTHCGCWFYDATALTRVTGLQNLDVSAATSMAYMFENCGKLAALELGTWDTAKVTDMTSMFAGCSSLKTIAVSDKFSTAAVTANVTHMNNMFYNCSKLANIYVSPDFTTAKVTTTVGKFGTFTGCTQLPNYNPSKTTADQAYIGEGGYLSEKLGPDMAKAVLSADGKTLTFVYDGSQHYGSTLFAVTDAAYPDWHGDSRCAGVTKVVFDATFAAYQPTTFSSWFNGFSKLATIEGWENLDTSAAESMAAMFALCPALSEVDLSRFDTAKVKTMENMFRKSTALTVLDLSSFDTAKVVNMKNMFNGCTALKTIYASNKFVTSGFSYKAEMFTGATALVGGAGTAYAADHIDSEYARIDTASTPGYFAGKNLPVVKIAKPTAIADLVYTATEQTGVTYDERLQVSGPVKAIKAGEYEATFTLPADSHYVFFSDHGGKITEYVRFVEDGKAIGALPEATRDGYDFDGWFTEAEGGDEITATKVITSDLIAHAQWTKKAKETVYLTRPQAVHGLTYTDAEQQGVGSYDSRIRKTSGVEKATATGAYAATYELPADTETQTFSWDAGWTGAWTVNWSIAARSMADSRVTFDAIEDVEYPGEASEPEVKMTFNGAVCAEGTDYAVAYSNNVKIVLALGQRKSGFSRDELMSLTGMTSCGNFTRYLRELEECGFVRKRMAFGKKSKGAMYQLIDNFMLSHLALISENKVHDRCFWTSSAEAQFRDVWEGLAFERLCLQHVREIKAALGISGVASNECSWQTVRTDGHEGAQVDLVIDRKDGVINLCEMKFAAAKYEVKEAEERHARERRELSQSRRSCGCDCPNRVVPVAIVPIAESGERKYGKGFFPRGLPGNPPQLCS